MPVLQESRGNPRAYVGPALAIVGAAVAAGLLWRRARRPESFEGQTVLITGGSRGLGFAMARRFAREGAVLAICARSTDQLDRAAARLRDDGAGDVLTIPCDVRDPEAVRGAVATVVKRTGRIDVLVNNAGVIQVTPFEHAQLDDFRASLETHFWGPLHFVHACLPHFRRQQGGRVVNIASIGGRIAVPHLLPYTVGKFALVGLSEGLRAELHALGVSVTTVTPHLMQTGSHRNVLVRGQHAKEATWFALGTASRLTSLDADVAATRIVEAARARRASVTPGWQARVASLGHVLSPALSAALTTAVTRLLLPSPAADGQGDRGRLSRDLDLGATAGWFATDAAREYNQRVAPDERAAAPSLPLHPREQ